MPFMTGLIVNVGLGTGGWSVFITVHVSLSIMGGGIIRLMGGSCYNWEQEAGQCSQQFMYHRASGGGYQVDGVSSADSCSGQFGSLIPSDIRIME